MNTFDAAEGKPGHGEHPDQPELRDPALDGAAQEGEERTGDQHGDAVEKARQAVHERVAIAGDPTQGGIVLEEGEPTGTDADHSNLPPTGP